MRLLCRITAEHQPYGYLPHSFELDELAQGEDHEIDLPNQEPGEKLKVGDRFVIESI